MVVRWCTTCEDDVMVEQPGCADDHGDDCPEWTCVGCGDAMFVGFSLPERLAAGLPARSTSLRGLSAR